MIKLIKPKDGMIIPMPEMNYTPLPIDGMQLIPTTYWLDREKEGGVVILDCEVIEISEKEQTKKKAV